jgi:hypothetical protein
MVGEDRPVFLEWGAAHCPGVLLEIQEPVELLPGQAVANQLVRLIPPALGGGVDAPSVGRNVRREPVDRYSNCAELPGGAHGQTASVPDGGTAIGPLSLILPYLVILVSVDARFSLASPDHLQF